MTLRAKITAEEFERLKDHDKEHYTQDDSGENFVLAVSPVDGYAMENVKGLTTTLGKLKKEVEKHKEALQRYYVDGELLDPDYVMSAIKKTKETPASNVENSEAKTKAAIADLEMQYKKVFDQKEGELKKLRGALESAMIDEHIKNVLLREEKSGSKNLSYVLLPHVKKYARLKETEKGFVTTIVDDNGDPRLKAKDGQAVDFLVEDLLDEFKTRDEFKGLFSPPVMPGGGTTNAKGSSIGTGSFIKHGDKEALGKNIDAVASGKIKVVE